jgi:hypothetical protein
MLFIINNPGKGFGNYYKGFGEYKKSCKSYSNKGGIAITRDCPY